MTWLGCELEKGDSAYVATLHCLVCKRFEEHIQSCRNFSSVWITGSTNKKLSNVIDHASSESHKAAMAKLREEKARQSGTSVI